MQTRTIDLKQTRWYRDVPAELVARLERFRADYPYRRVTLNGVEWPYIAGGSGEPPLLLLSGATCIADMSWQTIAHFAQRCRVIAPDYPALDTMAELTDGIAALLEREGIAQAHVFGGSYGGLVAQVFVRRHPGRSAGMILSHTLLPNREGADALAGTLRWLPLLPAPVLRALFRKRMEALFAQPGNPQVALSKALFDEIVAERVSKPQLISLMRRVADLDRAYNFAPGDLEAWPGRSLLLMADDDPATPPALRDALVAMYPRAQVRLFSGSGHMTAVLKQDEYFAAIEEFVGVSAGAAAASAPHAT